jgi:hypothetical protein
VEFIKVKRKTIIFMPHTLSKEWRIKMSIKELEDEIAAVVEDNLKPIRKYNT